MVDRFVDLPSLSCLPELPVSSHGDMDWYVYAAETIQPSALSPQTDILIITRYREDTDGWPHTC